MTLTLLETITAGVFRGIARCRGVNTPWAACIAITCVLAGCHRWQDIAPARSSAAAAGRRSTVRIDTYDGRVFVLRDAQLEGDSIVGTNTRNAREAVAMSDIARTQSPHADLGGDVEIAFGMSLLVIGGFFFAMSRSHFHS